MSAFSLQRILPVLLASAFTCGSVCAEEETDKLSAAEIEKLDSLRFSYDLQREEIQQKQWVEPMEKLRSAYKAKMKQLLDKFSSGGDLAKSLAVRNAAKNDPTTATIHPEVKEIAEVQKVFIEAHNKLQKRLDDSLVKLARSHVARLSTIKEKLTQAQRFDSALAIEQEIKQITAGAKVLPESPKKPRPQWKKTPYHITSTAKPNPVSDFEWKASGLSVTITRFVGDGGKVVIPNRIDAKPVTSIGTEAFRRCASLTSITIPDGVTSIEGSAFYDCTSLTRITIPDSVTSIGSSAFRECHGLTSITIGNSVTSIGQMAFYHCRLTNVTIPDSVTSIGDRVFHSCESLTSINIPDSVTSIGERAFYYCINLTSITIPDNVTSIGDQAFEVCRSLTAVTFLGDAPKEGEEVFKDATPTIYRKPEAKGWGDKFAGRPVKLISEKP